MAAIVVVLGTLLGALGSVIHRLRRRDVSEEASRVEFAGRTRDVFIKRVWDQRIIRGLERSLRHAAEIHLGLRNTPELLLHYSQSTAEPGEVLTIESAYAHSGEQLVI